MTDPEITATLAKIPDLFIEARGDDTLYITVPARSQQKKMIIGGLVAIIGSLAFVAMMHWAPDTFQDAPPFAGSKAKLMMMSCLCGAMGFAVLLMSANFGDPKPGFIEVAPAMLKALAFIAGDRTHSSFVLTDVICFEAASGYLDVITKKGNTRIMNGFKTNECLAVGCRVGKRFWHDYDLVAEEKIVRAGGARITTYLIYGVPNRLHTDNIIAE